MRLDRKALYVLAGLALICGCTVKAYDGPEIGEEQVSSVTVRASGEVTIESVTIDGRAFSAFGDVFQVLPGRHSFEVHYRAEQPDEDCRRDDPFCSLLVDYGRCKGWVKTQPGRTYLVSLSGDVAYVRASVLAKGYFDLFERSDEQGVGAVSCGSLDNRYPYRIY